MHSKKNLFVLQHSSHRAPPIFTYSDCTCHFNELKACHCLYILQCFTQFRKKCCPAYQSVAIISSSEHSEPLTASDSPDFLCSSLLIATLRANDDLCPIELTVRKTYLRLYPLSTRVSKNPRQFYLSPK